jgi:hypothetical protein
MKGRALRTLGDVPTEIVPEVLVMAWCTIGDGIGSRPEVAFSIPGQKAANVTLRVLGMGAENKNSGQADLEHCPHTT